MAGAAPGGPPPMVSVIIPVYGSARTLRAALDSVLRQSFTDLEILIVDDASPDHCVDLCRRLADPRLTILRHAVNQGVAAARNTGLHEARGSFIAFLDSDDLWRPHKLARQVRYMEENPRVGVAYCQTELLADDGTPMGVYQMPKLRGITRHDLLFANPIKTVSGTLLRRDMLLDLRRTGEGQGDFDESLLTFEDVEYWLRLLRLTSWRIEGVPEVLVGYRMTRGSLTCNSRALERDFRALLSRVRDVASDLQDLGEPALLASFYRYLAQRALMQKPPDGKSARHHLRRALQTHPRLFIQDRGKTPMTLLAIFALSASPRLFDSLLRLAFALVGSIQRRGYLWDARGQARGETTGPRTPA